MDHLSRVDIFLQVAEKGSFSKAARCLKMSSPAVSKHIQTLENQLGVKLLYRTTRHVSLTEQGAIYAQGAKRALDDLDELQRQILELKDTPVGRLKINAPLSFSIQYLNEPIAKFACQYPHVNMDVDYEDHHVDVIAQGYDVVIRIASLKDSSLKARKLADCPLLLCASPHYLKNSGILKSAEDLTHHKCISYTKHDRRRRWNYIDSTGKIKGLSLNSDFSANNAELMLTACLQGFGIALLPIFSVANYLKSGKIVPILTQYKTTPELAIYALYPSNRHLSIKVRLFIDELVNHCKTLPW